VSTGNFFEELKRRHVYRVASAYVVFSWLVIQAATIVFPAFNAPPWVLKVIMVLLALGFPIAVALAWAFEITPEGIKRTDEVTPDERTMRTKGRKLAIVTAIGAVVALALLAFGTTRGQRTFARLIGATPFHSGASDA
jgi:hypothetical protein